MEEEVKEIAKCCICMDQFTDPRVLPCIHTFCLNCLSEAKVKAEKKPGDSMPCPLCRTPFVIPKEGMVGLKKNFFADRLVKIAKMSKPSAEIKEEFKQLKKLSVEAAVEGQIMKSKNTVQVKSEKKTEKMTARENRVEIRSTNRLDVSPFLLSHSFADGVTKLQNKIYVLISDPKQILVFADEKPFGLQMKIEIREIGVPGNIESREKWKSLFIFDSKFRCIWKMTAVDKRIIKWLSNVDNLFTISPLMDDQLLIFRKDVSCCQLETYGSDGNLVRSVPLPSVIVDPRCCIQKQNGDLIISHKYEKSGNWTISQLSSGGQKIIRQVTLENESLKLSPVSYSSLCLDSDTNRLFAAEFYNHKIALFDSNSLELKQILLTKREHGITFPHRLFYDSHKKQLLVPCSWPELVIVYDLCIA